MTFTGDTETERRCRSLVAALDLGGVSEPEELAAVVGRHLDISIRLRSLPEGVAPGVSGGCLVVGERDVVVAYLREADPWYAMVTLGHELGHLLCGHLQTGSVGTGLLDGESLRPADDVVAGLLPDLAEAQRTWQLFRCLAMSRTPEREAELVGSLLVERWEDARRSARSREAGHLAGLLGNRGSDDGVRKGGLRRGWGGLLRRGSARPSGD